MAERTAASGRLLQPASQARGAATRYGTAPFRLLQRGFTGTGTGLVVLARARRLTTGSRTRAPAGPLARPGPAYLSAWAAPACGPRTPAGVRTGRKRVRAVTKARIFDTTFSVMGTGVDG